MQPSPDEAWRVGDSARRLIYNLLRSPTGLWEALKLCYNESKPQDAGMDGSTKHHEHTLQKMGWFIISIKLTATCRTELLFFLIDHVPFGSTHHGEHGWGLFRGWYRAGGRRW